MSIKGAEDVLNKPHAFEITTVDTNFFFIADSDKVCCSHSEARLLRDYAVVCSAAAAAHRRRRTGSMQ